MLQTNALVKQELNEGGRVFIICPLVEESDKDIMAGVKAAEQEHEQLQQSGVLGDHSCGLLHGRMSAEEKFAAMQAFATGETPVLISTTVVEVSVLTCNVSSYVLPLQNRRAFLLLKIFEREQGQLQQSATLGHHSCGLLHGA